MSFNPFVYTYQIEDAPEPVEHQFDDYPAHVDMVSIMNGAAVRADMDTETLLEEVSI